jgi:hypothetical protein
MVPGLFDSFIVDIRLLFSTIITYPVMHFLSSFEMCLRFCYQINEAKKWMKFEKIDLRVDKSRNQPDFEDLHTSSLRASNFIVR